MEKILIKNGLVLSMAQKTANVEKKDILVEDNRISKIEECISDKGVDKVIDATGMVVMPGLVNCHNHAAMVLFRGYSDDLRLMEWLTEKIWPAEDKMTEEDVYWGTALGCAEMIKSGTTTFADMYVSMDGVARAVDVSGIRASLCRGATFFNENVEEKIKNIRVFTEKWEGKGNGRITTMIGPHAPYTVPPDAMKAMMQLADEMKVPIHIHLAETTEEVEQIFKEYGKSPTKYLSDLGLFENRRVLLAHSVNLSRDDIYLLKGMIGGISHNPVSNMKLGCGIAPIKELRDVGVEIGLGTDGAGSATTLDMFEEIKATAWLQKNKFADPTVLNAYDVLYMSTMGGAKVLGFEHKLGSLEIGKLADIIIIDMNKPHLQPNNDVFATLAYAACGSDVDTVLIDGKVVMEKRNLKTMSENEIFENTNRIAERIFA